MSVTCTFVNVSLFVTGWLHTETLHHQLVIFNPMAKIAHCPCHCQWQVINNDVFQVSVNSFIKRWEWLCYHWDIGFFKEIEGGGAESAYMYYAILLSDIHVKKICFFRDFICAHCFFELLHAYIHHVKYFCGVMHGNSVILH